MSAGFCLAVPVGSRWQVYHHGANQSLGGLTVLSHRRIGVEVHWDRINRRATIPYPNMGNWHIQADHIRLAGPDGKLRLTLAPD